MRIHNVRTFLASAAIVVCASLSPTLSQAAQPGLYLNGVDVEGNPVRMAARADITPQAQRQINAQQASPTHKFFQNNEYLCTIDLNIPADSRLQNRTYANSSNDPSRGILFAGNVSNFYQSAHELAHCFNHNRLPTAKPLVKMMVNPEFSALITPLGMLEHSIQESYADLSAALHGASKTGDWTVFTDGVMRARSGLPDPMNITTNAVSTIIAGIDPRALKGRAFSEINARINQEFRINFMDSKGEINLGSRGVTRIMQEMNFLGERLKGVAEMPGVPAGDAQQLRAQAGLIEAFSTKVYGRLELKTSDYAFLTAMQIVDARQQQKLAKASVPQSPAGQAMINQIVKGMDERQRLSVHLYTSMTQNSEQAMSLLVDKVAVVEKWVQSSRSNYSANLLNEGIQQMIARDTTVITGREAGLRRVSSMDSSGFQR